MRVATVGIATNGAADSFAREHGLCDRNRAGDIEDLLECFFLQPDWRNDVLQSMHEESAKA